jgi:hypothetical protein
MPKSSVVTTDYRDPDVDLKVTTADPHAMDPVLSMSDGLEVGEIVTSADERRPSTDSSVELDGTTHTPELITWSARLKQFARPTGYYVLSRLLVLFAALASKWLVPRLHPLKALTSGWDGYWYTLIAQHGYPHQLFNENHGSRWAFFPAYPAAIRATVATTGLSYAHATLLLSFVLGLTSALAIWLAVRQIFGPVVADRSVLLYVFFPASYVLSMAYTEGLFITAVGACLYALARRYWITAALFAVLGSLTRSFGVVLIACVIVTAIPAIFRERKLRPLVALVISPLGFLAWLAYSWAAVGNPLAFLSAEKLWGHSHFVWFLTPILSLLRVATSVQSWRHGAVVLAAVALVIAYGGFLLLAKARDRGVAIPLFWWVFTVGSILGMMSSYEPVSVLRYSLAVIPLFAAYAWRMRPSWEGPVIGVLAFSQGVLAVVIFVGTLYPHSAQLWP